MELDIEKLVYGGDGLARLPESGGRRQVVFVPFTVPGERVEAAPEAEGRGSMRARLLQVLRPSPDRVEARCEYFGRCGGCQWQHINHERQLQLKSEILLETLQRTGGVRHDQMVCVHASPAWGYRNRVRLQVSKQGEVGFFRHDGHRVVAVTHCPIASPELNAAIAELAQSEPAPGEVELVTDDEPAAGSNGQDAGEDADGGEPQWFSAGGHRYRVSPGSFFQVNRFLIADLVETVTDCGGRDVCTTGKVGAKGCETGAPKAALGFGVIVTPKGGSPPATKAARPQRPGSPANLFAGVERGAAPVLGPRGPQAGASISGTRGVGALGPAPIIGMRGEVAVDLFSGVGLFALPLAERYAQVEAVEENAIAAEDLRFNSQRFSQVSATRGDALAYLSRRGDSAIDLLVADPPRSGLGPELTAAIQAARPARLHLVSCDPATLGRDLRPLLAGGYGIEEMHLFDFFPQTYHIETVVKLVRS